MITQEQKERYRLREAARRMSNPELYRERSRASYHRHAEQRRLDARIARERRKSDPERLEQSRKWKRDDVKHRKETDPQFRVRFHMRNAIWMAMMHGYKAGKAVDAVGCSMAYFRKHLESLWQPGMSWENYGRGHGKWHIDHKLPCSSFDLTDPEQVKKCYHFSNTQPLWAKDNLQKSNKVGFN